MSNYHPEPYWSDVARRIKARKGKNVIAGDDEPYYRYKRERFLSLLHEIDFKDKTVLEIGSGPGGNLKSLLSLSPRKLTGVDISPEMIELAKSNLPDSVDLIKVNAVIAMCDQALANPRRPSAVIAGWTQSLQRTIHGEQVASDETAYRE